MSITNSFQARIDDKEKYPLADGFIRNLRTVADANSLSEDEVWTKWQEYSDYCRRADMSAVFSEFCQWNKLVITR